MELLFCQVEKSRKSSGPFQFCMKYIFFLQAVVTVDIKLSFEKNWKGRLLKVRIKPRKREVERLRLNNYIRWNRRNETFLIFQQADGRMRGKNLIRWLWEVGYIFKTDGRECRHRTKKVTDCHFGDVSYQIKITLIK